MSGVLPPNWTVTMLSEVADWSSGGTPKATEAKYYNGDIPWLVIMDLNNEIVTKSAKKITQLGLENSSAKWVDIGSVMVAMYGSIGKLGIAGIKCTTNQAIAFTTRIWGAIPNKYIFYYLQYNAPELLKIGQGGAQKNISQSILKMFPFLLPPLNEQKRIVAKLDAIMPRIDSAKKRLEKIPAILKRFRQSVLTAAVTGKLTEKWREEHPDVESVEALLEKARGFKKALHQNTCIAEKIAVTQKKKTCFFREEEAEIEGIELPRSWNTTYLGNISWVQGGVQKTPKRKPVNNFYRYLSVANVYRGFLKLDNVSSFEATESEFDQYKLIKGDLLIVEGNGSAGEIGRCAIWSGEIEKCIHQNHIIRARPVSSLLDSSYSMLFFNSNFGIKIMMGIASTTSGLYTLSVSKVNNLPIPLPPLDEQKEIVRQVDKLFALADKVEEHYQKARARVDALAQSVLAKAFRGELVPQDPDDEPAEKLLQRIREEKAKMENELKTVSRSAWGTRRNGAKTQRAGAEEKQASEP